MSVERPVTRWLTARRKLVLVKCRHAYTMGCSIVYMSKRQSNKHLDHLAQGYDCPRCGAFADMPCTSASGLPHQARVDKAVSRYQRGA